MGKKKQSELFRFVRMLLGAIIGWVVGLQIVGVAGQGIQFVLATFGIIYAATLKSS